jgi:hypothetical protein
MAQYKHLPIYKVTYELLEQITRVTKDFPRDYKYSLGVKLRDEVVDLVVFVYKANTFLQDRGHYVLLILERMQVVELLVRLCKDMRLMSIKQFSETVLLTDSVARQAQGWLKTVKPLSAA